MDIKTIKKLLSEVESLETRKANLEEDISKHYKATNKKLETEYRKKLDGVAKQYADLKEEQKKLEVNRKEFEKVKADSIDEIKSTRSQLNKDRVAFMKLERDAKLAYEEFKEEVATKTKQFKGREDDYTKRVSALKDSEAVAKKVEKDNAIRNSTLLGGERDVRETQKSLMYQQERLDSKLDEISRVMLETEEKRNSAEKDRLQAKNDILNAENIKKKAKKEVDEAKKLIQSQSSEKAKIKNKEKELKDRGDNLSVWRDKLQEDDKSLEEKRRYLIRQERVIQQKIKVLKDLRK